MTPTTFVWKTSRTYSCFIMKSFLLVIFHFLNWRENKQVYIKFLKWFSSSEVNSVSLKSMEVPWNHYYAIVRRIASFTGMWPYMKPEVKRFAIFLLVISMITVIIPEVNCYIITKKTFSTKWYKLQSYNLYMIFRLIIY